jgi:hypothetical protein
MKIRRGSNVVLKFPNVSSNSPIIYTSMISNLRTKHRVSSKRNVTEVTNCSQQKISLENYTRSADHWSERLVLFSQELT